MPTFEAAARSLKVAPIIAPIHSDVEIEAAITALGREPGGGLVVLAEAFTAAHRAPIILAAARNNVPAVYMLPEFPKDGGLLSYEVDSEDIHRRAATYVGRILSGAKPADLPVLQPTKFELVINLKTAKALGLTVPETLLATADGDPVKRRQFIAGLGSAVAWPLADARAAAKSARDRVPLLWFPETERRLRRGVPAGPGRCRLCRGPECGDRIPLG